MSTIAEIRERWEKATRGPWRWFGNTKSKDIYMATTHSGRVFVMQFERYGRSGAQPVFQVRTSTGGIMTPAHNLVIYEAPHRADISGIDHPDAIAIEHAWEDIQSLLGEIDRLAGKGTEPCMGCGDGVLAHSLGGMCCDVSSDARAVCPNRTAGASHG